MPERRKTGASKLPPGIVLIPLPGRGAEKTNCYAIIGSDESVTLIDPGIESMANWESLGAALSRQGLRREAIRSVIVTHLHYGAPAS